ncbi:methyl-accepting chemotaxis protein [Halogeometricum borinquense]|uniref:methyl-accepting chemotaxis protein n=1 Tax=Halogeometricum borinquense TaxID=60847 RepID=UPI003441CFE1
MNIQTKLIALCLVISLVPVSVVGGVGIHEMNSIGSYAQTQSTTHMETQITGELNNTVSARREQIQNVLDVRRVDARSLANSSPVQNYQAAKAGQWKLVQRQSQTQLGHMALQMRSTIESTKQTILEEEYNGRSWEELTPAEQQRVKEKVERIIAGTAGNQTTAAGSASKIFQPGYIGDTGYAYITDGDSNVVVHHKIHDGFNLIDDASLTVFNEVESTIQNDPAVRSGSEWRIVEYEWEDTTQAGNPVEEKFVAYAYYEDFDWVLAPSVYYYELQTTASESAKNRINDSFENYLNTRSVSVQGEERPAYDEIILTDEDGHGVVRAERTDGSVVTESVESTSYADTEWFNSSKSMEKGEVHVGDVQTVNGAPVIYLSTPVYQNGEFAGTIALRFDYGILTALTNGVTVGDTGHLSIVNDEGRVLSHPNSTVVETESSIVNEEYAGGLASIAQERILAGERGLSTYTRHSNGEKAEYYVGYAPLDFGDKQFALLATVPEKDVTGPSAALGQELSDRTSSARNVFLLLIGGAAVGVIALGFRASRYFSRPIEQLRDHATALAEGRFDDDVDISASDDEIGELVDAFGEMQRNLRLQVAELRAVSEELGEGTLDQDVRTDLPGEFGAIMSDLDDGIEKIRRSLVEVHDVADQFADVSSETVVSAEEIEAASQATAQSVEEIAHGAEQQTEQLQAASDEMNNLSATIEEVAASADGVVETANEAASLADRGREHAADATEEISAIEDETTTAVEQVEGLSERIEEINEVVQLITEITEQTDLLALNASIEAARAGEVGKGFAVVANEIKMLANQAEDATEQVEELITEIQDDTDDTVEDIQSMRERVESGAETIEDAIEMFDDIAEASEKAEDGVKEISKSTEDQATSTEEVVAMVDEVSSVSEQTASEASTVSAATEEQTASINEVTQNIQTVSEEAQSLQELVKRFDVGKHGSASASQSSGSGSQLAPSAEVSNSEAAGSNSEATGSNSEVSESPRVSD